MRSWAGSISITTLPKRMPYTNAWETTRSWRTLKILRPRRVCTQNATWSITCCRTRWEPCGLRCIPRPGLRKQWAYYVTPPDGNPKVERGAKRVRDITLLDPACGGGHFLVRAFDLLASMYIEEGIEPREDIPALILERNLYGIDIDARAIQLAALALYLKGCEMSGPDFHPRRLNLISTDIALPIGKPPAEYMQRFKGDREMEELVTGIWDGLRDAPTFGSLLHPERAIDKAVKRRRERDRGGFFEHEDTEWERWKTDLLTGLRDEFEQQSSSRDLGQRLFGEQAAKGISLVDALSHRYDVVVANPPYAGSKSFDAEMKRFIDREYSDGKRDILAAFILRCVDFCRVDGFVGMLTMQSWMFLTSYTQLRLRLLKNIAIGTVAHLGARAFEEISGEVVNIALFTLQNSSPNATHEFAAFKLVGLATPSQKAEALDGIYGTHTNVLTANQRALASLPSAPLIYWARPRFMDLLLQGPNLRSKVTIKDGISSGNTDRVLRFHWEVGTGERWRKHEKGGGFAKWMGLSFYVIDWAGEGDVIRQQAGGFIRNPKFFGRPGLVYSRMAQGSLGARIFDCVFI